MIREKRREGLEQRRDALITDYQNLNSVLIDEGDPVRKGQFQRRLKRIEIEMDEIEKELGSGSSPLEARLHEIDFKQLEQILRSILQPQAGEACAALLLFQQSTRMGGEWCAARIREILRPMTRPGQFRHIPVEFQPGGRADNLTLLRRLGEDLGVDSIGQNAPVLCQNIVQTLCNSLQSGSIYMIECRQCDYLKHDPNLFRWVLEDFWGRVVQGLATVAQDYDEIKVIMLLFVDGVLPQNCLPTQYCCQHDQFQKHRLIEILLEPWKQSDIREWIARYSERTLRRAEIDIMADQIYKSTDGDPTLVAHALLRQC